MCYNENKEENNMQNKYYFKYPNNDKSIEEAIDGYYARKKKDKKLKFILHIKKDVLFNSSFDSQFEGLLKKLTAADINSHSIEVALDEEQRKFSEQEWSEFKKVDSFLHRQGIKFGFEDMGKTWSIKEVENANKKIVQTADEINKNNLSPYEKLLMAYMKVTAKEYLLEEKEEHCSDSRSVFGVLNSDKICCVGYSQLLKAIMEQVGDENIKIYENHVACSKDGKVIDAYHANLIINIKDDKYGIDGFYYLDPTWDSGHGKDLVQDLNYFMVPLSDIDKIKYQIRGEWAGLPEDLNDEGRTTKTLIKKSKNGKAYNRKHQSKISFTKDGFRLTEELMKDVCADHPELISVIKKEVENDYWEIRLKDIAEKIKFYEKKCDVCEEILKIIKEFQMLNLVYDDKRKLDDIIYNSERKGEVVDELIDWIEKYQSVESENECEKIFKILDEKFKENFDFIREQIAYYTEELRPEKYEEYCKEWGFGGCVKLRSREDFYEYDKKQLEEYQKKLEELTTYLHQFKIGLKTALDKKPELKTKLLHIDDSDISFRLPFDFDDKNVEEQIEKTILEFEQIETYSAKKILEERITDYYKRSIDLANEIETIEENIKPKTLDSALANVFLSEKKHCGRGARVDEWFKSKSSPVGLDELTKALNKVVSKLNKEMSKDEREALVREIIEHNADNAPKKFEETALNALMEYSREREESDEKNV